MQLSLICFDTLALYCLQEIDLAAVSLIIRTPCGVRRVSASTQAI